MTKNMQKLLNYLYDNISKGDYIPAQELTDILHVSSRQLRNYIKEINKEYKLPLIKSSHKGYRLDSEAYSKYKFKEKDVNSPKNRYIYIIQKLINAKDGYNIFDLSDELFVSIATIEKDLKNVRSLLSTFDIAIIRNHDIIIANGTEKNKRLLMQHLLLDINHNVFDLKEQVQLLTKHYHQNQLYSAVSNIFHKSNIFVNDYALNNTIIHLIIMIDRIRNGYCINDNISLKKIMNTPQYSAVLEIKKYVEKTFSIEVNDTEIYNLFLIVSNNTTETNYSSINIENISNYIEEEYIILIKEILYNVESYYYLDKFDDEFLIKFTLHIKNMFQRIKNGYIIKNPLTETLKMSYPLIYDISVFIALEFQKKFDIILNEDEITFLALHIGSYFENNNRKKVNCVFIYVDYYNAYQNLIEKITKQYYNSLNIKSIISVHDYKPELIQADLVLSMIKLPFSCECVILNPILQDSDYQNIDFAIKKALNKKRIEILKEYLPYIFNKRLFFKDILFKNKNNAIHFMCDKVINENLAYDDLYQNVMKRECMSSTIFNNIAIPHPFSRNLKESFICISICKNPVQWDKTKNLETQFILLMGLSKKDQHIFSDLFQELIKILSHLPYVKKLTSSMTFEEFIESIKNMIGTI